MVSSEIKDRTVYVYLPSLVIVMNTAAITFLVLTTWSDYCTEAIA